MSNFLISIDHDPVSGGYVASYFNGQTITLAASTYQDAVLEADMLELENYELGYN
jgi:hypothetical protein